MAVSLGRSKSDPAPEAGVRVSTGGTGAYFAAIVVTLADGLAMGVMLPLLPLLAIHFGAPASQVTWLVAAYALAAFVGEPLLGWLSDRIGRRRVILVSLAGSAIAAAGILLSASFVALIAFRTMAGLLAGRASALRALVTDAAPEADQVRRLSNLAALTAIGAALGPLFAAAAALGAAGPAEQYRNTMVLALVLSGLAMATFATVAARSTEAARQASAPRRRGALLEVAIRLRRPIAIAVLTSFGYATLLSVNSILLYYRFGWGLREAGLLLCAMAAIVSVGRMFVLARLVSRFGAYPTLSGLLIVAAPSLIAAGLAPTATIYAVSISLFGATCALATVVPTTIVARQAPATDRGYALGLCSGGAAIATAIAAVINGSLFEHLAQFAPHVLGGGALLAALALARPPRQVRA
ncbi:MAG: MFS transporter [Phenylobacterium sp.]|jgi:DHA1 family tetracycline resistance protein-like MFS transporter|uniref:MFS transporter n=1 Tax=Phenylobacterium sp. TaxID=1871053 RepID=UPI002177EB6D|nr:MFS transporter [Phenylobacterium sp.]MCA3260080.1 MFS transporter [Rubrivivax sp.]MCA3757871.1 MFS transporter [Phenylobacterium sp.]